jgi:general secretion pathway protein D
LPTFGNREISTVIRLHDGETNMLAGLIRDDERRTVEGIPGLSDIPGVGRLFARTQRTTSQTDIVLTLTPHVIRVLDLDEADLRAFRAGRDLLVPLPDLPLQELPRPIEPPPARPVEPPPAGVLAPTAPAVPTVPGK